MRRLEALSAAADLHLGALLRTRTGLSGWARGPVASNDVCAMNKLLRSWRKRVGEDAFDINAVGEAVPFCALSLAARVGAARCAAELVRRWGAAPGTRDSECGATPLAEAAYRGNETMTALLLRAGADARECSRLRQPDVPHDLAMTPAGWADRRGNRAVAEMLRRAEAGATPAKRRAQGGSRARATTNATPAML